MASEVGPKRALLSVGVPSYVLRGNGIPATVYLNFLHGSYYQQGQGGNIASLMTTSRASTKLCDFLSGQWITVASNTPCITDRGLLNELAATNKTIQSVNLVAGAWTPDATTVTSGQADPAGGTTAASLVPSSSNVKHSLGNTTGVTLTAVVYTASVYMKPNGYNFGFISLLSPSGTTGFAAVFDLVNGGAATATQSLGAPTATSASVKVYPNGWALVQVSMTAVATATSSFVSFGPAPTGTPTLDATTLEPTFAGDGVSGVTAWQPQTEASTYASSPVLTTTGNATRNADATSLTNVPLVGTGYTQYIRENTASIPVTIRGGSTADDGTNNNRSQITVNSSSQAGFFTSLAAVGGVNANVGSWVGSHRAAMANTPGSSAWVLDAGTVSTSATANVPSGATITHLGIGVGATNGNNCACYIEGWAFWPTTALPASALQAITSASSAANDNGELYAAVNDNILPHDITKRQIWADEGGGR